MKAAAALAILAMGSAPAQSAPPALSGALSAPGAREAIARVAYAEAGGQGDSGLAAVVFTILNRLQSGRWGGSVERVVEARAQFEPVLRAGGSWRRLRPVTEAQQARIDTILNLVLEGRLPDMTGGASYFQNPAIVAARVEAGTVSPALLHFGGARPSAVIGDHAFYVAPADRRHGSRGDPGSGPGVRGVFVLSDGQVVEDAASTVGPAP